MDRINCSIRFLVANATHLVQPADSFVISKIKDVWKARWERYKFDAIQRGEWQNRSRKNGCSGALKNPGKTFFLELAAQSVRSVNAQRDKNGLSYARKAMIRTGLSLDVNGEWHVKQLSPELQAIIKKHPGHFNGQTTGVVEETE